jgi:hypothetical protein
MGRALQRQLYERDSGTRQRDRHRIGGWITWRMPGWRMPGQASHHLKDAATGIASFACSRLAGWTHRLASRVPVIDQGQKGRAERQCAEQAGRGRTPYPVSVRLVRVGGRPLRPANRTGC